MTHGAAAPGAARKQSCYHSILSAHFTPSVALKPDVMQLIREFVLKDFPTCPESWNWVKKEPWVRTRAVVSCGSFASRFAECARLRLSS